MTYRVPIEDILFNFNDLALLDKVNQLPTYEDFSADVVQSVLEENARLVQGMIAPLNKIGDEQHATWHDGQVKTPDGFKAAFDAFIEGGWQGLQHDPEHGGQGAPKLLHCAVSESINSANLAFALCPLLSDGLIEALTQAGSDEQKKFYIQPMLEGRWTGTMNLTEPQAGSDLALVKTKAVPQDDGTYRIFGQKIFITYGEHDLSENIIHLVLARTPNAPEGVKGISLFIVPKFLMDENGQNQKRNDVYCASLEHKLGIHASPTAVLLYGSNQGEVGEGAVAYLIGEENKGLQYMFIMMNAARFNVGLQGLAISERATQLGFSYAQDRMQGNSVEGGANTVSIIHHPDVQRMLMTMKTLTDGSRSMAMYAAMLNDLSLKHADANKREQYKALYEYMVPIVKGFCTENAIEISSLGVQVHGGMGYIEETGAAQHYRDARILAIYEGTTAIQANDLVGRKTLRDQGQVIAFFSTEIARTIEQLNSHSDERLQGIAVQLTAANAVYQEVIAYIFEQATNKQMASIFMGSVPYLMLSGYVHVAWHMAQAALVCVDKPNQAFYDQKLASAIFYSHSVLPRIFGIAPSIKAGQVLSDNAKKVCFKV